MSRSLARPGTFLLLAALGAVCAAIAPPRLRAAVPVLDVGLLLNRSRVAVSCSAGLRVLSGDGGRPIGRTRPGETVSFSLRNGLVVGPGGRSAPSYVVEPLDRGHLQAEGAGTYRGTFRVVPALKGGGLNLINDVDIESYLLGVLKAEMLASFHSEALKAQAVVCRTFALRHKDAFRAMGFGLKATEQSQMYEGLAGEDPRTSAAVMATRGIVMLSEGKPVEASYHSCCGGRTEDNENVWEGGPRPYTRSVRCDWCGDCPHAEWRAELSYEDIEKALTAHGWGLGGIRAIDLDYSDSGRVRYVVITTAEGRKVYVPGNKFRIIVDRRTLKSLRFVFKDDPVGDLMAASPAVSEGAETSDAAIQAVISGYLARYAATRRNLVVEGRGFGHGVGLCQWGANGLASTKGASFRRILSHYYQHVELAKIH